MELPPLTNGTIVRRYKRFFADVEVPDAGVVTAHCPNTGSMKSCWAPGAPVQISSSDNPRRKLKWTLERVDMGAGWVGVNTNRVNAIIAEGVQSGNIEQLAGYENLQREPACPLKKFPKSRLDMRLTATAKPDVWVEVKNVTLLNDDWIEFPDAVTSRGLKHLEVLSEFAKGSDRAVLVFAINRPEAKGFRPAAQIDPDYAEGLKRAISFGVEVLIVRLKHNDTSIDVSNSTRYF